MRVTLPNDLLHLLCCAMGGSFRAKAETRIRECRIEDRHQNLNDGLLNQAIEHVWNSEQAITVAIGFGDGFATYRLGPIRPTQELLDDYR